MFVIPFSPLPPTNFSQPKNTHEKYFSASTSAVD